MSNVSHQVCEAIDLRREYLGPLALWSQFRSQFSQFFRKAITKPKQLTLKISNLSYLCLESPNLGCHIGYIFSGMEKLFILKTVCQHILLGYGQDWSHLFYNHGSYPNFLLCCSLLGINFGFERIKLLIYLLKPKCQSPSSGLILDLCHRKLVLCQFVHFADVLLHLPFVRHVVFRFSLFRIHRYDYEWYYY